MKDYLEVLWVFLRVGMFTFGGGYAIIPVVERELIRKKAWVTMDEVMDFYTVSQIMPGMIGVNLSIFIGNKQKGAFAGFLAALGFVLPGATLITLVALFISNFADIPIVRHAFAGIRIAVAALIVDTVLKLIKGVFKDIRSLAIYIFVFAFSALPAALLPAFLRSPMFLVVSSGLAGLALFRQKKQEPLQ
jgi:chromate transporter